MDCKQNIGTKDKLLRIVIGIFLVLVGLSLDGSVRWIGVLGLVPLVSAAFGICPAYSLLKVNTLGCCGGGSCGTSSGEEKKKEGGCCGGGGCQ